MNRLRYHEIVETDHDIQNPMSPAKLRRVIDYLRLRDGERIIDVGSGKGWLMHEIAATHRVAVTGLEFSRVFAAAARARLASATLLGSAEIVLGPALDFQLPKLPFDVGLCIGATFALNDFEGTLDWMARAVRPGGRIAIGEPFMTPPFPDVVRGRWPEYQRTPADIGQAIQQRGYELTGLVAASEDDWDHYECQHWRAAADWLRVNPNDPDAAELAAKNEAGRADYLEIERSCYGWAIFVAEKTA